MKIENLLKLNLIDENQKIVVALFDGHSEEVLFKGHAHKINDDIKSMTIEENGLGSTTRHLNSLYIMVERQ